MNTTFKNSHTTIQEVKKLPEKLDLQDKKLTSIHVEIFELGTLEELDLSVNLLNVIPDRIGQLRNLTSLHLQKNRLVTLPHTIGRLQNLKELNLGDNHFIELPDEIIRLQNLKVLLLGTNHIIKFPHRVNQLKNLRELNLSHNQFIDLPDTINQLQNLRELFLDDTKLISLPDTVGQLQNLIELHLNDNQLITLPDTIGQLQNLTKLYLNNNQLTTLPDMVGQLQNLIELHLNDNQLITLPDTIGQLQNLTKLYLNNNQLTTLPDTIGQLQNLTELYLEGNQFITLPNTIARLQKLTVLKLAGNPIKSPPPEIVKSGINTLKAYLQQLEKGKDYLYEAKLLIVGESGAGKTTLAKKIQNPHYQLQEEDSTRGINVIQWEFPLNLIGFNKKFRVNIWDFGGQEIYHATHQFFLTKRSLYALVADTRKEDTDFYYWLNVIELLSDNSPVLIIKNEKQDRRREINERQLRAQFTNLEKILSTNLATNRNLDTVTDAIKYYINHLSFVGDVLPKTWIKIRERLEKDPRNYISLDEYLAICQQNDFTQRENQLQLSSMMMVIITQLV